MGRFVGKTLLQVTPRLDSGGVERTTVDIAAAFVREGGRSLVASAGGRLEAELREGGSRLCRLPLASKNPLVIWRNASRLAELIRREGVDIVHARSRAPAWSALWAARRTGVPFVTTYHGIYSGSGLKQAYNAVMARGDVVIANSRFTRNHILAAHKVDPDRVVAIDRGVDLERLDEPGENRLQVLRELWGELEGTIFLLPARLTPWKGHDLAIAAAARLTSPHTLILAGEGKPGYAEQLRRNAPANVRLVGHVSDMAAAYSLADFVLAPSLDPEAFGRTVVEPQAMRRPVLAAAHGAPADSVVDGVTGWLVAPGDVEAWARAMQRACETPTMVRVRMGAAGRARAEANYSVARMARATLDVYARCLGLDETA
jgi:glycosyltransferase involved in cell wall biosynthesis